MKAVSEIELAIVGLKIHNFHSIPVSPSSHVAKDEIVPETEVSEVQREMVKQKIENNVRNEIKIYQCQ